MSNASATRSILLLGAGGQLGRALTRDLAPLGTLHAPDRGQLDIGDPSQLREAIRQLRPAIIVNASAYTAVDMAESEPVKATLINADAVGVMAGAAVQTGALLVHYSSDYVFDGASATAYRESDAVNPLSAYGASKAAGEQAILNAGCRALILRTSWLFGRHGGNFVKTILRLAQNRDALRIVADQIGQPTPAALVSGVTALLLHRLTGAGNALHGPRIYHLASRNPVSWQGFACAIVEQALRIGFALKLTPDRIFAIGTADYPLPARRPLNSRLDVSRIETEFGLSLPDWQPYLTRTLQDLKGHHHG